MVKKIKLKRGQKQCKKCGFANAARSRKCTECGSAFKLKKSKVKGEIVDWKSLQKGDEFRTISGTGPYYVLTRDCGEGKKGEILSLRSKGAYAVSEIKHNGISAYGISAGNSGYSFIYMGKKEFCEETSTHRRAHRIAKVFRKRRR